MEEHNMTEDLTPILNLPCRCCMQQALHAFVQPPPVPTASAYIYVHCTNPECKLWYVTREYSDWLIFDVSVWGATQHPAWRAPGSVSNLRMLVESHIREQDAPLADLVLRDFREQLAAALPYRRRACCEQWLHLYTRTAS